MTQQKAPQPLLNVWDEEKQQALDIPLQEAQQTLFDQSSPIGLVPGQKYYFRNSEGGLVENDNPDEIFDNIKNGFIPVPASQAEKEKFADTIPGQLATTGLSALKGATAGLSDVGIMAGAKALDLVSPGAAKSTRETLNALYDTNPIISAVGNIGGTIGGFFYNTPIRAISALGQATQGTKAVAGLANLLSKVPYLGGALAGATKLGAGSAVEGALFGLGRTLSEEALGKTDDVAESLLANTKNDALVGGAIGGGLGFLGGAAGSVLKSGFAKKADPGTTDAVQKTAEATDNLVAQAQATLTKEMPLTTVPDQPGVLPGQASRVVNEQPILKDDLVSRAQSTATKEVPLTTIPDEPGVFPGQAGKSGEAITMGPISDNVGQQPIPTAGLADTGIPGSTGVPPVEVPQVSGAGVPPKPPIQEPLPSSAEEFIKKLGNKHLDATGNLKNFSAEDRAALSEIYKNGSMTQEALLNPKKFKEAFHNDLVEAATQIDDNAATAAKGLNEAIDAFQPDIDSSLRAINNIDNTLLRLRKFVEKRPSEYQARQLAIIDLTEKRLASLVDVSKRNSISTTRNVFKDLREFKQDLFQDTTAGLRASKALRTSSDQRAAEIYDEIYDALNKNLKDESLFGDVGKTLSELDQAQRAKISLQQELKDLGVLQKSNRGYVVNERAVQRVMADERKRAIFQEFLDSDLNFKKAAGQIEALTGKQLNLGEITPRASERARVSLQLQELYRNELTTGKAAIIGDIIGAIGGTVLAGPFGGATGYAAARALGHALENPALVQQRLAQLYVSAGRLGEAATNIKDIGAMIGSLSPVAEKLVQGVSASKLTAQQGLAEVIQKINAEDTLEAVRYMQMKDAEKATKTTSKAVNEAAAGLLNKNPPKDIGPQSFNRVKPLTPESFVDFQEKLLNGGDAAQNIQQAMSDTMPKVSQVLAQRASEAKNFLITKLPPLIPDELGIERAIPDAQALAKFSRYVDAVESPMGVLANMKQGYITQEGMETLKAVYPAMWAALQEQVKAGLKDTPSPKQRQLLAQILNGSSQVAAATGQFAQAVWSGALQQEEQNASQGSSGTAPKSSAGASPFQKAKISTVASNQPSRRGAQV